MLARLRSLVVLLLLVVVGVLGTADGARAEGPGLCNKGRGAFGPNGYVLSLSPSGTSATVGTPHTITVTVTDGASGAAVPSFCVDFVQSTGPSTGWPRYSVTGADGKASVTWTSATTQPSPTDSITAEYKNDGGSLVASTIRHTWVDKATPPPTTAPPSPTRSPTPSPTPSPNSSPTSSPTASPTTSPSASPTPSPTTSLTPSPTPTASATAVAVPPTPPSDAAVLHLDTPSTLPGGSATLTGSNCPAGSTVSYSVEGSPAGTSTAKDDGSFGGDVQLPDAAIGEHLIQVSCAGRSATVPIDLVVSSSASSSPAVGATVAAVLLFFLLLGSVLLTRGHDQKKS